MTLRLCSYFPSDNILSTETGSLDKTYFKYPIAFSKITALNMNC